MNKTFNAFSPPVSNAPISNHLRSPQATARQITQESRKMGSSHARRKAESTIRSSDREQFSMTSGLHMMPKHLINQANLAKPSTAAVNVRTRSKLPELRVQTYHIQNAYPMSRQQSGYKQGIQTDMNSANDLTSGHSDFRQHTSLISGQGKQQPIIGKILMTGQNVGNKPLQSTKEDANVATMRTVNAGSTRRKEQDSAEKNIEAPQSQPLSIADRRETHQASIDVVGMSSHGITPKLHMLVSCGKISYGKSGNILHLGSQRLNEDIDAAMSAGLNDPHTVGMSAKPDSSEEITYSPPSHIETKQRQLITLELKEDTPMNSKEQLKEDSIFDPSINVAKPQGRQPLKITQALFQPVNEVSELTSRNTMNASSWYSRTPKALSVTRDMIVKTARIQCRKRAEMQNQVLKKQVFPRIQSRVRTQAAGTRKQSHTLQAMQQDQVGLIRQLEEFQRISKQPLPMSAESKARFAYLFNQGYIMTVDGRLPERPAVTAPYDKRRKPRFEVQGTSAPTNRSDLSKEFSPRLSEIFQISAGQPTKVPQPIPETLESPLASLADQIGYQRYASLQSKDINKDEINKDIRCAIEESTQNNDERQQVTPDTAAHQAVSQTTFAHLKPVISPDINLLQLIEVQATAEFSAEQTNEIMKEKFAGENKDA